MPGCCDDHRGCAVSGPSQPGQHPRRCTDVGVLEAAHPGAGGGLEENKKEALHLELSFVHIARAAWPVPCSV